MSISLLLFTNVAELAAQAIGAGIDGIIIDWERHDTPERQVMDDGKTDSLEDLQTICAVPGVRPYCRINPWNENSCFEMEQALTAGAEHILLTMVHGADEVEQFIETVAGRARTGIMVETVAACDCAGVLAKLPIDFVYVGLFDLALSSNSANLFQPFLDHTVMRLREQFASLPFGVGGLTTVDRGTPIPCLDLMAELARHHCDFTFLRRSFKRDIIGRDMDEEVAKLQQHWARLLHRSEVEVERDHRRFSERVANASFQ